MASSNRHWPSMFKSKPCSAAHPHHHWQHAPSLSSGLGVAGDERSPEPKPRWNPRPEQIRILETIFNSGMVNPPRDEIRKIRMQLQEYGQVGDANVFYWFQNRKSRSKHKQRLGQHLQSASPPRGGHHQRAAAAAANSSAKAAPPPPSLAVGAASSSSSSERSIGSDRVLPMVSVGFTSMMEAPTAAASPTASVNQGYFQTTTTDFFVEPVYIPGSSQGFCLPTVGELSGVVAVQEPAANGPMPGLWTELITGQLQDGDESSTGAGLDVSNKSITAKIQNPNPSVVAGNTATTATVASAATFGVPVDAIQGIGGGGGEGVGGGDADRSTVFINGVGFDVVAGPFNVREVFSEEAVLIHASGHPVLTDEWGISLHPLQHGASYFLI